MECGVCWRVYDPAVGDDYWQIPPGTPFSALPDHWTCPNCDTPRERFVRLENPQEEAQRQRVTAFYERVARESMADVPICNDALSVEVVDIQPWRDGWLLVLLTPWCLNLLYLPEDQDGADWQNFRDGDKASYLFPAGRYSFVKQDLDGLGRSQTCSLVSPMGLFADQDGARLTAQAILAALNDPANGETEDQGTPLFEQTKPQEESAPAPVDRRQFLRGKFQSATSESA